MPGKNSGHPIVGNYTGNQRQSLTGGQLMGFQEWKNTMKQEAQSELSKDVRRSRPNLRPPRTNPAPRRSTNSEGSAINRSVPSSVKVGSKASRSLSHEVKLGSKTSNSLPPPTSRMPRDARGLPKTLSELDKAWVRTTNQCSSCSFF